MNRKNTTWLLLLLSFATFSAHAVQLNEIRIDQGGSDLDEYFELTGNPGESMAGLTYLVIGDGSTGSGTIEAVIDLNAEQITASGFFTAAEASFTLATADLTTTLNFENSDNVTHMLVSGFTGSQGDDIDADDDGVIDNMPYGSIVDSVALKENDFGEHLYSSTIVGPDGNFVPAHVFLCDDGWEIGDFGLGTNDTPGAENDCGNTGPVVVDATIPEIQSNLAASPFEGQVVRTTGVVTGDFQGNDELRGFYMQDVAGDGDTTTSDGIFVFGPNGTNVNVGDVIEIVAEVDEFFNLTELKNVQSITFNGTATPTPTAVSLPETVNDELEQYEGMLVEIVSDMTVAQNFFLGRFGQLTLSSADDNGVPGRLFQPTNLFPAATQASIDEAESNARRILILDDGQDISGFGDNPNPVPYLGFPPTVLRGGDSVINLIGILDYGRINSSNPPSRDYRLHPTQAPVFLATNPRENVPQSSNGDLSVASFNVLNFFTTLDGNGSICGPAGNQGCRGADSATELQRQQDKLVSAITAMNSDVVGLIEIENNGYLAGGSISTLVDALNASLGSNDYAFVTPTGLTALGTDAIAVGFIYKPAVVTPVGTAATLDTGAFDQTLSDGRSRQPLAVSFEENTTGEQFTAVINHFKSKRPPSQAQNNGNDDQGDGQGSWNLRRTEAANDLAVWLAGNPTGISDPDVLIMGDLNAYAEEDPMLALESQGFTDLVQVFNGDAGYTFTFDGQAGSLDQALAGPELAEQVTGVVEWHINTDEPPVIDYNQDFNPPGYYTLDSFRSSDHDPVIVGLTLFVDSDDDGVRDASDLCADTPAGSNVTDDGCSAEQFVELHCEQFFPGQPHHYLRCVFRSVVKLYRDGVISRHEARRIYFRAIIRVFFSRY